MKPTDFIPEKHAIGQAASEMHGDHEIQMAREECYHAATNAMELHRMLKHVSEQEGLQAWASEKITLANDYLRTVKEWLEYEIMTKLQDSVMSQQAATEVLENGAVTEGIDSNPVDVLVNYISKNRPDLMKYGADRVGDAIDQVASRVGKTASGNNDLSNLVRQVEYYVKNNERDMYEVSDFKKRELEHELSDEDSGQYYVMIVKGGKWEYTKAQPKQKGMNAATDVVKNLHAKYPNMHLGLMGPDGKVQNLGKGKVKEDVSAGGMGTGAMATGAAGSLFGGKVVKRKSK
jgi:ribosomal protein S6